jgi:hypothetical protein
MLRPRKFSLETSNQTLDSDKWTLRWICDDAVIHRSVAGVAGPQLSEYQGVMPVSNGCISRPWLSADWTTALPLRMRIHGWRSTHLFVGALGAAQFVGILKLETGGIGRLAWRPRVKEPSSSNVDIWSVSITALLLDGIYLARLARVYVQCPLRLCMGRCNESNACIISKSWCLAGDVYVDEAIGFGVDRTTQRIVASASRQRRFSKSTLPLRRVASSLHSLRA